ncbi:hypothetical protein [Celeribacter litoreus]|uniref:hypothetical protein n=1 Tax=Celeribacter litoreus TaxID=2876714 RepID=UPI001CCE2D3D|nr:hypothetical protein [Celeribacter litoreus]MCA0043619.1 hypothetical protein [Celeribacter litoreus]
MTPARSEISNLSEEACAIKPFVPFLSLGLLAATPVIAEESLCGWTDEAKVVRAIAGTFDSALAVQIEADLLSTRQLVDDRVSVEADGHFTDAFLDELLGAPLPLTLGPVFYDVDAVDDLLETTGSDWIADAVSLTPCGPEGLPQLSAAFEAGEGLYGQVTLIPYFTDKIVMLIQMDYLGEWGMSEITGTALLTPNGLAPDAQSTE